MVSRRCLVKTRAGEDLLTAYNKRGKLGEGAFGEVFLVQHKSLDVFRVCKMLPKTQLAAAEEELDSEVQILKSLDHPHIVRIFETFENREMVMIVMDYAAGEDLRTVLRQVAMHEEKALRRLPPEWVREGTDQMLSALAYCHQKGVLHSDVKPANAMLLHPLRAWVEQDEQGQDVAKLDPPHILLVDFGLSEMFDERAAPGTAVQVKGTPAYLSPEGFDGNLSQKGDVWAVGVMVYEMMLGERPFQAENVFGMYSRVTKHSPVLDGLPAKVRTKILSKFCQNFVKF